MILETLNPQQYAAATSPHRVTKTEAGAGTGKTFMLMGRIEYLLDDIRDKTFFSTFTVAAAEELTARAQKYFSEDDQKLLNFRTVSSLGDKLVQDYWRELGFSKYPRLVSDWDLVDAFMDAVKSAGGAPPESTKLRACLAVEAYASACDRPVDEDLILKIAPGLISRLVNKSRMSDRKRTYTSPAKVVELIEKLRRFRLDHGMYLFKDQVSMPIQLPDEAFKVFNVVHLLVDEAQDLNWVQHKFIQKMNRWAHSLTFVGDESQSIFGFQGSQPEVFRNLFQLYPKVETFRLETNYRSTQTILDTANQILKHELGVELQLESATGEVGSGIECYSNQDEMVTTWIRGFEQAQAAQEEVDYSEIAILYRARKHVPRLEMALTQAGIPYVIDERSFFEEAVVQDMLSYLWLFESDPQSERYQQAWKRIIQHKKYLGFKTRDIAYTKAQAAGQSILDYWRATSAIPESCRTASQRSLWRELLGDLGAARALYSARGRMTDLMKLAYDICFDAWEERYDADVYSYRDALEKANGFIDFVADLEKQGVYVPQALRDHEKKAAEKKENKTKHGVRLMTLHKAKGLEWDYVGLWNVGPTTLPLAHGDPMEERRLCYVGITRGRKVVAVFVNPDADRESIDPVTGNRIKAEWQDHPILKYAGSEADEFMKAVSSC